MATTTATTIEVNGFAYREIRIRSGIDTEPCAQAIGISRAYLANIELGQRVRVKPSVFAGMLNALQIADRRAILADPHAAPIEVGDEEARAKSA
jgi:transcriptional regulator with XRE-family HTH domain